MKLRELIQHLEDLATLLEDTHEKFGTFVESAETGAQLDYDAFTIEWPEGRDKDPVVQVTP